MKPQWEGVYPALTTKFNADESIDLPLFSKNIRAQIQAGVQGLIVGGSLGEAALLSLKEKEFLVRQALSDADGIIPVILNIAENSTKEAKALVEHAEQWGVHGLMILPPMRYKSDEIETLHWFSTIAQSTTLPIMIYNNPVDYKIEVTPEMFEKLALYDHIEVVKESTRDVTNVTRMINRFGDRFKILCGVDTIAMEALTMGAEGWVAGLVNAFPEETVALYRLVREGRMEEALLLHRWFLPLLELDIHPKLVQYIKLAEAITGLGSEHVRAPRLKLEGEERKQIVSIIENALANKPALPEFKTVPA
ncbi:MAG TPA: dihydrodipicolinate synthase family protein [Chitinophagaceae bacterium]